MSTINISYGAYNAMTITSIGIAPSLTAGWQSARVSNLSTKALDYEILVNLAAVNTAPANDKAVYLFAVPWVNDDSTNYYPADIGVAGSLPSGSEGTITVANIQTLPSNFTRYQLGILQNQVINTALIGSFFLSNVFGASMPDCWSLILINYTGATLTATGSIVAYRAITQTVA